MRSSGFSMRKRLRGAIVEARADCAILEEALLAVRLVDRQAARDLCGEGGADRRGSADHPEAAGADAQPVAPEREAVLEPRQVRARGGPRPDRGRRTQARCGSERSEPAAHRIRGRSSGSGALGTETAGAAAGGSSSRRPFGLRLIVAYKSLKALLMFGLALWLSLAPASALRTVESFVGELSSHGATFVRLREWVEAHLSGRVVAGGALLAWGDGLMTVVEVVLLLLGKAWGEWLVAAGIASLLPVELWSLGRRPGFGKLVVLLVNAAIVIYLFRRRIHENRARRSAADVAAVRRTDRA